MHIFAVVMLVIPANKSCKNNENTVYLKALKYLRLEENTVFRLFCKGLISGSRITFVQLTPDVKCDLLKYDVCRE